ncbi:MAG: exopolyphosphatase, partial [Leeuwenhoekiella sp.]
MLQLKKYGAIDIGSNAIRLLVANVIESDGNDPVFRKNSLVRVPIRLGADVFKEKRISEENITR